jgi:hypothetical protein
MEASAMMSREDHPVHLAGNDAVVVLKIEMPSCLYQNIHFVQSGIVHIQNNRWPHSVWSETLPTSTTSLPWRKL